MALKLGGKKTQIGDKSVLEIARAKLRRLATLTDCVYAVSLILIIQWLPLPEEGSGAGSRWLFDLWAENAGNLVSAAIAVVFVVLYWLRNTDQMARLQRNDSTHVSLSIAGVFFLLLLLYMVRVGGELEAASARAGESFAVALVGFAGALGWWHARRKGLVWSEVPEEERIGVQIEAFTEPLTALSTIPFAYVGELWWNLAWLLYLPVAALLRRRLSTDTPPDP